MTEKRGFWYAMQAGSILLYALILGGSYLIGQPRPGWLLIGLLALLHLSEMRIAIGVGKEKGISLGRTVLMNMLFGFTWWVPLKKGVIKK